MSGGESETEAIEGLYSVDQLETVAGQQEIYRIAAARDRSCKNIMPDTQCKKCNRSSFYEG